MLNQLTHYYERPLDEPEMAFQDADEGGDAAYDAFVDAVDRGEQCPDCHGKDIGKFVAQGLPLFECKRCKCAWFDFVTRETQS